MKPPPMLVACVVLCAGLAMAQDKPKAPPDKPKAAAQDKSTVPDKATAPDKSAKAQDAEAKEVSGMSIVGNSETPKSLTIIPWKSSEIGRNNDFRSSLLNHDISPIDKPSFLRELDFYKLSTQPN